MNVTIIQPPLVQLNTPYPSGAYLKSFFEGVKNGFSNVDVVSNLSMGLGDENVSSSQVAYVGENSNPPISLGDGEFQSTRAARIGDVRWLDLSNALFHKIFSSAGLRKLFALSENSALEIANSADENAAYQIRRYISLQDAWCFWIDRIVEIACGGKSAREYTHEFVRSPFVPRGNRMENFLYNLGRDVTSDDAQILASLALADLADYITMVFDENFRLISYAERLGTSEASFDSVINGLKSPILTEFYDEVLEEAIGLKVGSPIQVGDSEFDESPIRTGNLWQNDFPISTGTLGQGNGQIEDSILADCSEQSQPDVQNGNLFLISVPFPGCFESAVYTAKKIREMYGKNAIIAVGGGFVNTELRNIKETRFFDYFDFISYDMGYGSYLNFLDEVVELEKQGKCNTKCLKNDVFDAFAGRKLYKIKYLYNGKIVGDCDARDGQIGNQSVFQNDDVQKGEVDLPNCTGTLGAFDYASLEEKICKRLVPDYTSIDFSKYPRLADDTNPMHRIWNDGAWLKAYLAHGCYWHRCAFCDTTLEYVNRFCKCDCNVLCDGLTEQAKATGVWGIHFVDEACPPSVLLEFGLQNCQNSAATGKKLTYWGNIRFEKTFTRDLANFLSYSGLTAVSAGIEIATGDGLEAVNKGTTIENIVKACCAFKEAGILVHSYMIFGFYNQTEQDLINSMETLRQLFKHGLLDSAFWHKFTLTLHSTVYKEWLEGKHPNLRPILQTDGLTKMGRQAERIRGENELQYGKTNKRVKDGNGADENKLHSGIQTDRKVNDGVRFAENDLRFEGEKKSEKYSVPLNAALDSWMHGENLDVPVTEWFDFKMPTPTIGRKYIKKMIESYERDRDTAWKKKPSERDRFVWLGGKTLCTSNILHYNTDVKNNEKILGGHKKDVRGGKSASQSGRSNGAKITWQFMGEEYECVCDNAVELAELLNGMKPEIADALSEEKQNRLRKLCDEKILGILRRSGLCRI